MNRIVVKGDRDGLVVLLPAEGDAASVLEALREHLSRAGAFFKGSTVTLEVGERPLARTDLDELQALFTEWEVTLVALRGEHEGTRAAALEMGLDLPFVVSMDESSPHPALAIPEESAEALLVRRTLRSGQLVRHPGAVIVLGDVNPGAEIVAGGDVVVWGVLRGLVHAGAPSDDGAIVLAITLAPTQLRIGPHIAAAPEEPKKKRLRPWKRPPQGPEMARVHDGAIVVEAWKGKVGGA